MENFFKRHPIPCLCLPLWILFHGWKSRSKTPEETFFVITQYLVLKESKICWKALFFQKVICRLCPETIFCPSKRCSMDNIKETANYLLFAYCGLDFRFCKLLSVWMSSYRFKFKLRRFKSFCITRRSTKKSFFGSHKCNDNK